MKDENDKTIHRYHLTKTIKVTVDYVVDAESIEVAEQDDKLMEALAEQLEKLYPHLQYNTDRFFAAKYWSNLMLDLTHGKMDVDHSCDDDDCMGGE